MRQLLSQEKKKVLHSMVSMVTRKFRKYVRQIIACFLITAVLAVLLGMRDNSRAFAYVVYLDDEEIGIVSDEGEILDFVALLYIKEARLSGLEVQQVQEVRVEKESRNGVNANDSEVRDQLRSRLQYNTYGYLITVNDMPTIAVGTLPEYEKVLENIKLSYVSGKENSVVQAIVLNEKIEAKWDTVDQGMVYSADIAAEILKRGTDKREVYLVSRGDTIWGIARANNLTEAQIRAANPRLQTSDRLQIGEQLELIVAEPLVHVSVTEVVTVTENIPFKTTYQDDGKMYKGTTKVITGGIHGKKEVTYRITRENGQEVEREALSQTVLQEPRTQVVARGTAVAPVAGTGQFIWPVPSGGRITSPFGPRGRSYHYGIDIGAPTGTAIVASDAGVVIYAGWAGSYGNLVTIDHGNGFITKYAHCSAVLVSVGQKVQKGTQIARVGSTGNSTGPHLHFEIIRNGTAVNPLNYFRL
ncbi:MAG: M23 family metallopeptidase [Dethiobacter sp.]|jgi:murein DD-endopeptidase MepM/ murein hydrolase activator NlpD|nr:M23 family metallopeptidase [Dethiobacter sp.]